MNENSTLSGLAQEESLELIQNLLRLDLIFTTSQQKKVKFSSKWKFPSEENYVEIKLL
jgi:hypothetical protein